MMPLFDSQVDALYRRRDFLRMGGGLAVSSWLLPDRRTAGAASEPSSSVRGFGQARSCILVYLLGGPPHLDMWDLKPRAPTEIRGPFRPISTNVSGIHIGEHLPRLAGIADKYAIARAVSHPNNNHTPMIYYTLTGFPTRQPDRDNDVRPPQRSDFPHLGAVVSHFKPARASLPGYVAVPELAIRSSTQGEYKRARLPLRGGRAGFLGARYDPLVVNGPPGTPEAAPALSLPQGVSAERFEQRKALLSLLDRGLPTGDSARVFRDVRQRAISLTGAVHRGDAPAFSLDSEPPRLRQRYGTHRFGRTMLLARRLAEAGVAVTAIHFNAMTVCDGWDLHSKCFEGLRTELLPMLDQSLSALIEDLQERGLLSQTLVVCMGEFGRTPKINKNAGRDHWGECSSVVLAGGGIRGGQVHGSSDRTGAFPASDPVDPVDIQATIYHALGLSPRQRMVDLAGRQWPLTTGKVIRQFL